LTKIEFLGGERKGRGPPMKRKSYIFTKGAGKSAKRAVAVFGRTRG